MADFFAKGRRRKIKDKNIFLYFCQESQKSHGSFWNSKTSLFYFGLITLKKLKALSQVGKYGLRALLFLVAYPPENQYLSIRQIADELGLSFHFVTKIFRELTEKGILVSYRGPSGGVALAKPAEEIFLIDVIKALEGEDYFDKCLVGLPHCGSAKPCPVHDFWKEVKIKLQKNFSETSLALLGEKIRTQEVRLDE